MIRAKLRQQRQKQRASNKSNARLVDGKPLSGMTLAEEETARGRVRVRGPEPFNSTPMAANSVSSGTPHVRPRGGASYVW